MSDVEVVGAVDAGGTSTAPPFTIPDTMAKDLVAAWAELSNVHKSRQAHQYKYADLADVMDVVRPVLAAHNLALVQPLERRGALVVVHTWLVHTSGNVLRWEFDVAAGQTAQQTGSGITYARRYAVLGALGVAAGGDDDDGQAASATPERESFDEARLPPSKEQLATAVRLFAQLEIMAAEDRQTVIAAILGAPERPWKELSRDEARDVIAGLTERVDEELKASAATVEGLFDEPG